MIENYDFRDELGIGWQLYSHYEACVQIYNFNTSAIRIKLSTVVVALLVEQSLLIPEFRSLNPVIGKKLYWIFTINCIKKTKKEKFRNFTAHRKIAKELKMTQSNKIW